ncbi:MAG: hypothetical protein KGJ41_09710 [Rhodospirillales bacterium]|nr:hypothetical protein [Rhodospirillales bacterium]MDE2199289.1 hypothetical protein [Rhodospirillales bacterium]MDE2575354.1 hypothetical protein [Rhodospirillales bacterium]
MFLPPALVVHGLVHTQAALRPGLPVTLLSAPGAAIFAGCGWWRALMLAAGAEHHVLDCADAPGRAMEALRLGQQVLVFDGASPAFAAVSAAAAVQGALVLPARPIALDLAHPDAPRRLIAWLQGDNGCVLG